MYQYLKKYLFSIAITLNLLFLITISISCSKSEKKENIVKQTISTSWSYSGSNNIDTWAQNFPLCSSKNQSPISLPKGIKKGKSNLTFNYDNANIAFENLNGVVLARVQGNNSILYNDKKYTLSSIQFHTPGEHKIKGKVSSAEVHFLYQNEQDTVIVAFFIKTTKKNNDNSPLSNLFKNIPITVGSKAKATIDFKLLTSQKMNRFEYTGSLTTPPCTAGVSWILMNTPIKVSSDLISRVAKLGNSARPLQDLNNRVIAKIKK